ncbi:unnamed protein product [Moneuplotes crassus]|uniref:Uncharacterized protein n=1 Tax=Euplotes crassus TaxID=5936 RepID=A0AAD2CZL2_EUPCR|nr:unnamed protein product [Moneuplotes crassus]
MEESEEIDKNILKNIFLKIWRDMAFSGLFDSRAYNKNVAYGKILELNCRFRKESNLCNGLKPFVMFNLNKVSLNGLTKRRSYVKDFLTKSFPKKIVKLYISFNKPLKLNSAYYMNSMIKIGPNVQKIARFKCLWLNSKQLKRLLSAYKHVTQLSLSYCLFCLPAHVDLTMALKDTQITHLSFSYSSSADPSDWKDKPTGLLNLLKSLGTSLDLILMLQALCLAGWVTKKSLLRKTLSDNNLGRVKLKRSIND